MKILKKIGKILLWIVVVIVALLLALPLWIGPAVRTLTCSIVPAKTGTSFDLGEFGLNQYSGRLTVGDMRLFNPEGFSQKMAVTLGKLHVDVDMRTVLSDTIVFEDIVVKDVFVSYVSNKQGESNFAVIKRNATGEKAEVKGNAEQRNDSQPAQTPQAPQTSKTSKKIIIDHLKIENALVQLGPIPVPFSIELNGIGRKSAGVTAAEAWDEIWAQITASIGPLGDSVNAFLNSANGLGAEHAGKLIKGMGDALKGGTGLVNGATSKTVNKVNEGTGKVLDAVNEGTGKAVDVVGEGTGKAVDAVGEGTGKAVDVIKGLFK